MDILDLPMEANDAKAKTIRDYLKALLSQLWEEEEGFSGKRPFGNSGWQWDVYRALIKAGAVRGKNLAGDIEFEDYAQGKAEADALIHLAIGFL